MIKSIFDLMKTVELKSLDLLSENEENSTWEFRSESPSKGRILAFRAKGTYSGNHWHKGNSAAKNPEELLLISGSVLIEWSDVPEKDYHHQLQAEAPCIIKIFPMVKHRLKALEDICFLEANSIEEHKADTYYPQ